MVDEKQYQVERTSSTSYLDETESVVQGYLIRVRLFEFGEVHELRVPDLEPNTVKQSVESLIKQRKGVASLG